MHPYQRQKDQFTLSTAATHSMLVKVKCTMCRAAHLYHPDDVQVLCGDIAIYQVASWFRCEKCDTREWMTANWARVEGPDVGKTKVRRLVRVRQVRVPVWREEVI